METWIIISLIAFSIVTTVAIIVVVQHLEKKRREALENFANELSLDFFPDGHAELESEISGFGLFNQGHSRKIYNVILGETEIAKIALVDYRFTTGSGKNQQTHNQTVVVMESDQLQIPAFTLRPESLFDWFGSMMGFQDIDFDNHPEFSKMFVLKGPDEEAIRKFFDQELLDFFAGKKGISFEAVPGKFIYFRGGKRTKPEEMRDYLTEGYGVYQAFMERLERG